MTDRIVGVVLVGTTLAVLVGHLASTNATGWHFFTDASRLLWTPPADGQGGLALYASRPDLQFGPLAIVAATPFAALGEPVGRWAVLVAGSALGLVALACTFDAARRLRPDVPDRAWRPVVLVGGATFVVTWGDVAARTAHLDDAVALAATAAALSAAARGRSGWLVAALAVAAAAKPWAIAFAPLAAVPPGRGRWLRPGAVGALAVATWLPFVLHTPATLDTTEFGIPNDPTSVLRALGVTVASTPSWVRPAQLVGGGAIALALVASRRWPAVVLAAVAWRLLLEPGANRYYTVGLVLGGLFLAAVERPVRVPLALVAAAVVLEVTAMSDFPGVPGRYARLAVVVVALAAAARSTPRPGVGRPAGRVPVP